MRYEEWLLKEKKITKKAYKKLAADKKVDLYIEYRDSKVKCGKCGGIMVNGSPIWGSVGLGYPSTVRSFSVNALNNKVMGRSMVTADLSVSVCKDCGNVEVFMDKENRETFFAVLADLQFYK